MCVVYIIYTIQCINVRMFYVEANYRLDWM